VQKPVVHLHPGNQENRSESEWSEKYHLQFCWSEYNFIGIAKNLIGVFWLNRNKQKGKRQIKQKFSRTLAEKGTIRNWQINITRRITSTKIIANRSKETLKVWLKWPNTMWSRY
jgi:hypothetical protein